jgi:hypothetical protein
MKSIPLGFIILASLITAPCLKSQPRQAARPQSLTPGELRQHEAVVFDALDLSRPELAAVAAAWNQHDAAAAEKALATYLRTRTTVEWAEEGDPNESPASRQHDREVADNAIAGKLEGGGNPLRSAFANGDVDWYYNATQHAPGVAPDDEWQWQLNRMEFWGSLGRVYKTTHDERYAQTFVRELRSWVAQAPVPDHAANVPDSAWRTIEAGIRMGGSWPAAFFDFRQSPSMTDTDLILFAGAILDHGRYLRAFNTRLNWFTMEMSGLYAAGALFPEFKEATDWRSFAANHLAEEARQQILPDGAQAELSTSYQNVALGNILKVAEIARWTGRTGELPAGYSAPLEKGYEWQLNLMAPDRTTPRINDAGINNLPAIFAHSAVENFPKRADFKWVASGGAEGKGPDYTSIYLNRSGLAVMRSGWDRNANYLMYRLGPLGMGHMHQDKLNLIVYTYGREMIFDSGGGSYEHSKWRQWAVSTYSHNCVIVDGLAQNRVTSSNDIWHDADLVSQGPIDARWESDKVFDFASGEYTEGYGPQRLRPAAQYRDVLFLKPDLYIVADRMRPNDAASHTYEARWQLLSAHTILDPVTHVLATTDSGQANIAIVPLLGNGLEVRAVSGQENPEILGWDIRRYEDPERVPATTLLHMRTDAGPQLLLTLLVPLKPGEENPIAHVEPGQDGTSSTITFKDGRKFLISAPGERGIAVTETLPDGSAGRSAASTTN